MAGDIEEMQAKMTEMHEQLNVIAFWLRTKQQDEEQQNN